MKTFIQNGQALVNANGSSCSCNHYLVNKLDTKMSPRQSALRLGACHKHTHPRGRANASSSHHLVSLSSTRLKKKKYNAERIGGNTSRRSRRVFRSTPPNVNDGAPVEFAGYGTVGGKLGNLRQQQTQKIEGRTRVSSNLQIVVLTLGGGRVIFARRASIWSPPGKTEPQICGRVQHMGGNG